MRHYLVHINDLDRGKENVSTERIPGNIHKGVGLIAWQGKLNMKMLLLSLIMNSAKPLVFLFDRR